MSCFQVTSKNFHPLQFSNCDHLNIDWLHLITAYIHNDLIPQSLHHFGAGCGCLGVSCINISFFWRAHNSHYVTCDSRVILLFLRSGHISTHSHLRRTDSTEKYLTNSDTSSISVTTGFQNYTMYSASENECVGGQCNVFINHQTVRRLKHDTRAN